jgi:hypothetical protein
VKENGSSCVDIDAFLTFSMVYNNFKIHNMLAIMFDIHYKHMKCIQDFVNHSIATKIVVKYNALIVCPLLL